MVVLAVRLVTPASACSLSPPSWAPEVEATAVVPPDGSRIPPLPTLRVVTPPLSVVPLERTATLADEAGQIVASWGGENLVLDTFAVSEPLIPGQSYTFSTSDGLSATWVVSDEVTPLTSVALGEGELRYGRIRCPPSHPDLGSLTVQILAPREDATYILYGAGVLAAEWPGATLLDEDGWVSGSATARWRRVGRWSRATSPGRRWKARACVFRRKAEGARRAHRPRARPGLRSSLCGRGGAPDDRRR